jgi:DNA-binding CsgD family transcriptional regulator
MRGALSPQALSSLIGAIYDCALEPERWPETLTAVQADLDFGTASMSVVDPLTGDVPVSILTGQEERAWLQQADAFARHQYARYGVDLWGGWEKMRGLSTHAPAVQSQVTDHTKRRINRFMVEWVRPRGFVDSLIVVLANDATTFASLGFGRHETMGEIGEHEIEAATLLLPHLQRAFAIGRLLDIKSVVTSTFHATLDTLSVAVVLVNADLRIVHANIAARGLLATEGGIRSRDGVLRLRPAAAAASLRVAVGEAARNEANSGHRGFGIPAASRDALPHALHVLPLKHGSLRPGLAPSAVAAIFIAPVTAAAPNTASVLAALYDLTPAQARVFDCVAAGLTRSETAERLDIGSMTVKSHLAQIFAKTGTHRQAELVALAAAIAIPLSS